MLSEALVTRRASQIVLIVATLGASWLGMQAIHELGHMIGAWVSQGSIERVVLHPLTISRTDLRHNPHPLLVVWAGPILGCVFPLLFWQVACWWKWSSSFLLRFFAGFCLLANGLYIGVGSFDRVGDCGEMLRHGSSLWELWLFGALTAPTGLWLWHSQGSYFGWGPESGEVDPRAVRVSVIAAMGLVMMGLLVGGR
jgi:hypothetical protein